MLSLRYTLLLMIGSFSMLIADPVKPNCCKGPDLCTSYPVLDSCGWQFDIGLLAQQMRLSDSEICAASVERTPSTIPPAAGDFITLSNDFVRYEFDVDVGVRAGAGYYFENSEWLLTANFEWLSSTSGYTGIPNAPAIYRSSNFPYVFFDSSALNDIQFQEVDASLEVQYYLLDVILARGTYFSGAFAFEPFGGIQSSWIDYNGNKTFSDDANNTTDSPVTNADFVLPSTTYWVQLSKMNFWGVGPEAGLDSMFCLSGGWGIYSTLNVAVLFGETTIVDRLGFITIPADPTYIETKDTNLVLSPTIRGILGLEYQRDVYCNRQHLKVRAGFDARHYFNQYPVLTYQPQMLNNSSLVGGNISRSSRPFPFIEENGSFGMAGLILDVAFDF